MTKKARAGKRNRIKVDLSSYSYYLRGIGGIGKTTMAYELGRKLWGEDGMFIIQLGKEDGVSHLHDALYDEASTWAELDAIVSDLVQYRTSDFAETRMVCIDSTDELFRIAEKEVVRLHNAECALDKRTKSINAAFGGYGKGQDKAIDIVVDMIWKLKDAGYGLFFIGHTKVRTIKDTLTETEFDQLTTNISIKYDNAIKDKVYVTATAYVERDIDPKTKKVTSEKRVISFRDQSYAIDTKSRFTEITPKIDFDTNEFIKAMEDAIKAQIRIQAGFTPTESQLNEMKKEEVVQAEVASVEVSKEQSIKYLMDNFGAMDAELRAAVMSTLKENGAAKFVDATPEVLTKLVEMVRAKLG